METHAHNWKQLDDGTPFYFNCCRCGKRSLSHGDVRVIDGKRSAAPNGWADLNGEAFRAYYCDDCKQAIERSGAK